MSKYPVICKKPAQTMAVVTGVGEPSEVLPRLFPSLYASVYGLKFELKKKSGETFKVGAPIARWPDAHMKPKNRWTVVLGLAIPDGVRSVPQKDPEVPVKVEKWKYGTVAETVYKGSYEQMAPAYNALLEYIDHEGYEPAGVFEEEYLSKPTARVPKTLIRVPVRKKKK